LSSCSADDAKDAAMVGGLQSMLPAQRPAHLNGNFSEREEGRSHPALTSNVRTSQGLAAQPSGLNSSRVSTTLKCVQFPNLMELQYVSLLTQEQTCLNLPHAT
jgi:hypothetical protein